jgi:hypothetical protein
MMTVADFEERVWETDGIRIVVRAAENMNIGDYTWTNAAPQTQSTTSWLETRIEPNTAGHEVTVIAGNGEVPHGRTLLRTLRVSY